MTQPINIRIHRTITGMTLWQKRALALLAKGMPADRMLPEVRSNLLKAEVIDEFGRITNLGETVLIHLKKKEKTNDQ